NEGRILFANTQHSHTSTSAHSHTHTVERTKLQPASAVNLLAELRARLIHGSPQQPVGQQTGNRCKVTHRNASTARLAVFIRDGLHRTRA
uniref:Uncharacterized protein n=1 Tax=Anopheles atroparvus TaxID=41427 RepID=A0AAG5D5P3_ANOAO